MNPAFSETLVRRALRVSLALLLAVLQPAFCLRLALAADYVEAGAAPAEGPAVAGTPAVQTPAAAAAAAGSAVFTSGAGAVLPAPRTLPGPDAPASSAGPEARSSPTSESASQAPGAALDSSSDAGLSTLASGIDGAPPAPAAAELARKNAAASDAAALERDPLPAEQAQAAAAALFDGALAARSEAVAVPAAPKTLDPFGRDLGWDRMPQPPADAPRSVKDLSLDKPALASYTPSPDDWRDEIFYSALIDRFARAEPHAAWGDPSLANTRHGGNIRGLIGKLDYLKSLGVTTLLINPVVMNPPSGYHGYWAVHFLAVDPQIGTLADVQELVRQAHARGLRVVLDMVVNHTAPVAQYEGGYNYGPARPIKNWDYPVKPEELAAGGAGDNPHFSRRGDINDWNNEDQIRHGDLPGGVNHINTEDPATQDILLKVAKYWIQQTDVDGFRLDVYKHVAPSFWSRFFDEVRGYARTLGKNDFMLVGELYDGWAPRLAPEVGIGRLGSAYNYPAYYAETSALHGEAPTRALEASFDYLRSVLGKSLGYLVRFLDNHDRPRFLRATESLGILRTALAFTMLTYGIPYLYYGNEQAFRQVPGRESLDLEASRDDFFPEGEFGNTAPPSERAEMLSLVRSLAAARKEHPALRRGEQFVRWSDPHGPGLFAFSRIYQDEEVLVVINNAAEARSAEMYVDAGLSPPGTRLSDALDAGYSATARAPGGQSPGSQVRVDVPAYGVRVLVRSR